MEIHSIRNTHTYPTRPHAIKINTLAQPPPVHLHRTRPFIGFGCSFFFCCCLCFVLCLFVSVTRARVHYSPVSRQIPILHSIADAHRSSAMGGGSAVRLVRTGRGLQLTDTLACARGWWRPASMPDLRRSALVCCCCCCSGCR